MNLLNHSDLFLSLEDRMVFAEIINIEAGYDKVKVHEDRIEWFNSKGQLHREDGPAIEYSNGTKSWYLKGHLHREDGPAMEWVNGTIFWYLEGECYTKEEFKFKLKIK